MPYNLVSTVHVIWIMQFSRPMSFVVVVVVAVVVHITIRCFIELEELFSDMDHPRSVCCNLEEAHFS